MARAREEPQLEKPKGSEKVARSRLKDKQTKDKPKEERPWETNPEMTAVLLAALDENEVSKDLTPEQKLDVVDLAIVEKRFHDPVWLQDAVLNVKMQSLSGKKHVEIPVSRPVLITSVDELQEVINAHQKWISQTLEPTEPLQSGRANLKGNDLRSFVMDGVDLRSANLEAVNLSGVSLIGANLSGANLSGANLEGAILHKARLRRARLNNANLGKVKAFGTDFRQIQCEGTVWLGSELRQLIFDDTLPKKVKETMDGPPVIEPEIPSLTSEDSLENPEVLTDGEETPIDFNESSMPMEFLSEPPPELEKGHEGETLRPQD